MSGGWWRGRGPIAAIVATCLVLYVGHDLLRFLTFHAPAYDLGFFDQLTDNLSAGRGWTSSFIRYDFRGQHWEPILLVWAQLYRLVATPIWLLLISGTALALAPLAAWRLARSWLGTAGPAPLIAALATALSPLVLRTAAYDYHSETLTPVLALLALEAAARRRWLLVVALCAVLAILKEDALLVVAGIGWLIWRGQGARGGLALTAAALAGFAVLVGEYMPGLRGGRFGDLLARYAYLAPGATGPFQVLRGIAVHPGIWFGHLLTAAPLEGLAVALVPLGLLPLLSGTALLAVVPALAVSLLSSDPYQSSLQLQYGAEVFPLLLACALLGWRRLRDRAPGARRVPSRLAGGLAVAGLLVSAALSLNLRTYVTDSLGLGRAGAVRGVLGRVPPGVAVAASTQLVPHLSDRPVITEFPDVGAARWVVLDSLGQPSQQSLDAGYRSTAQDLPRDFRLVAAAAGVTLWERR